jgi:hypothetical protein
VKKGEVKKGEVKKGEVMSQTPFGRKLSAKRFVFAKTAHFFFQNGSFLENGKQKNPVLFES